MSKGYQENTKSLIKKGEHRLESILIGFPIPLSGIYGTEAQEQLWGAQVAIDEFNSGGGLDGRHAELLVRDTQLKVELAVSATEELILKNKVHFIVGALSAGDMLAISKVCHRHKILYNAISQSDSILYKENRSPYLFHEGQNPHMTVGSVGRYAFSHFGNRVAFLNADSEFGQHSKRALIHIGKQIGLEVVLNLDYPVGLKDYSPYLEQIKKAGPEVLVLNNFGEDQFQSVKQAHEMGLKENIKIVCPNLSVTQRYLAGAEIFEGVIGTSAYYWKLEELYPTAKRFNEKYRFKSQGLSPTSYSAYGYNGTKTVLDSVQKAKSIDTETVVGEMLRLRFDYCKGPQFYRRLDRQSVQSVLIIESKSKKEMKFKDDYFEILEVVPFLGPRTFLVSRETM